VAKGKAFVPQRLPTQARIAAPFNQFVGFAVLMGLPEFWVVAGRTVVEVLVEHQLNRHGNSNGLL